MKKFDIGIALACLLVFFSMQVHAKPENGLGLFAGYSSSTLDSGPISIDSAGPSFGIDYQFALNDKVSISPFYIFSQEKGDVVVSGVTVDSTFDITIIGAQVRFWIDRLFLGGHVAKYDNDFTLEGPGGTASSSEDGNGFGAIVGWETEDGLIISAQTDSVDMDGDDYSSLRAHVGFRFKM